MKKKNSQKPVVGTTVHYVNKRGVCMAAIVSGSYTDATYLSILTPRFYDKKSVKIKEGVDHSKEKLHRTWHYLNECKRK